MLEVRPVGSVDIGIEKKFPHSSLRLSYSDIFATAKWNWTTDIPAENLNTSLYLDFETTTVNITWQMDFGNHKLRSKKDRNTASKEEHDRLR